MLRHSWVVLLGLIILTSCGGGSGAGGALPGAGVDGGGGDAPSPFSPFTPPADSGVDPAIPADPAAPADTTLSLKLHQMQTSGIDCGEAISGTIQASGGTGNITWQAVNLPSWASAVPGGSRGELLTISGVVPYETCDDESIEVNPQACDGAGDCRGLSFHLSTDIPKISIKTGLSDKALGVGGTIDLDLKAKGGSEEYDWETQVNGIVASTEAVVSLPMNVVGIHAIQVTVKDSALGSRRDALIAKYGADNYAKLAMDVQSFTATVLEYNYIIAGQVVDKDGANEGAPVTSEEAQPVGNLRVPYQGKLRISIEGLSVYALTLPTESPLQFEGAAGGVAAGGGVNLIVPDIADREADLVIENVIIHAVNAAGEVEELTIGQLTFAADPCRTLAIKQYGNASYRLLDRNAEVTFQAENGVGPFSWRIISAVHGPFGSAATRNGDTVTVTGGASDGYAFGDASPDVPTQLTYTRAEDVAQSRWVVGCDDEDGGCRKIKLSGDIVYDDLPKIMDPNAVDAIGAAPASMFEEEKNRQFTEQLFVRAEDAGCPSGDRQKRVYDEQPISVSFPHVNMEAFEGAEVAVKLGINDTYHAEDGSEALLELKDRNGNTMVSSDRMDVDIDCGETGSDFHRWNWPDFPTLSGEDKLVDIDSMLVTLSQEKNSSWDFDYKVQQFIIVGKYWYYYDGENHHYTANDDGKDKYHTFEMDGGWFLKGNPAVDNMAWYGSAAKFDKSGDYNDCW